MTADRNVDENPSPPSGAQPQEETAWAPPSDPQWSEEREDLVEIVLQRTEQVIDALERVSREQPYLLPTLGALVVGLLVGWVIGGVLPSRKPSRAERVRKSVGKRAQKLADGIPSTSSLLPLAMELMRSPAIRDMGFKMAARAFRR